MERARVAAQDPWVAGVRRRSPHAAAALPVEHVLALQRSAGNLHVAQALDRISRPVLGRSLDTDFEHAGKPTEDDQKICDAFGAIVSDLVDSAHTNLLAGKIKGWTGARITAFLKLLMAEHRAAVVHAGNVIEERVYALMQDAKLPATWTPQFSAGMGGASKPDIVIHLSGGREGLIDITSQRGHILGKAGAWTTSKNYVYVAEAWFPSIFAEHLPHIRKAIKAGGLGGTELAAMQALVASQRKNRAAQLEAERSEAREIYATYSSFAAFVREAFEGDKRAAEEWMREHGMGAYKGVKKKKGPRKISAETREKRKKLAARAAKFKAKPESPVGKEGRKATALEIRKDKRQEAITGKRSGATGTTLLEAEEAETESEEATLEPEIEITMDDTAMDADEPEGDGDEPDEDLVEVLIADGIEG